MTSVTASGTAGDRLFGDFLGLPKKDRGYLVYLILVALFGWALASYDFNLLVFALPTVSKALHLSSTQTGLLVFIVYAALFVIRSSSATRWTRRAASGCGSSRSAGPPSSPG